MSELTNRIRKRLSTTDIPITDEQIFELLGEAEELEYSDKVGKVARDLLCDNNKILRGKVLELTKQMCTILGLPRYTLDKHLGVEKCAGGEFIKDEDVTEVLAQRYDMPYGYETIDQLLDKVERLEWELSQVTGPNNE